MPTSGWWTGCSRRRGTARELVASVLDAAARRGNESVVLEVAIDNEPARRLYAAAGFVAAGRRPRYYARRDYPELDHALDGLHVQIGPDREPELEPWA